MKIRIDTKTVSDLALRGIGEGQRALYADAKKALENLVDEYLLDMERCGRQHAKDQIKRGREEVARRLQDAEARRQKLELELEELDGVLGSDPDAA